MAVRYDGKLGKLVFASEDHRKPNIIRGNSGGGGTGKLLTSKFPNNSKNSFENSFKQTISSANNHNVSFPQETHHHFDSLTSITGDLDDDDSNSNNQIYITDDYHQLIQPSEISPFLQNNLDRLVHSSIQTHSGNYIMVIRDNEILSMHSQDEEEGNVESSDIVEENVDMLLDGTTECEEIESSNIEQEVCDEEIITAVQNIEPSSETELCIEAEDSIGEEEEHLGGGSEVLDLVEDSNLPASAAEEQYVMVQLPDGNNYLIPASSLQGSSFAVDNESGVDGQVFINENGDHQIIQVLNSNSEMHVQQVQTMVNGSSRPTAKTNINSASRSRKRQCHSIQNSHVPPPQPTKRLHVNSTTTSNNRNKNGNFLPIVNVVNKSSQVQRKPKQQQQHTYPQQRPLPQSRSSVVSSTIVKSKPLPEDLKPRPFRFDMPEDEIVTTDTSTDYLSLVIEQFQKENCPK
ncbi:uncharacterized protein LOC110842391 [Folsomia candida]|uniref:uncharacterized protein LOC110842391 n=1 Tax=Folsomia candida TaxID=158441 RepID=UPI000B8F6A64|nr:uncharacterized protein LOC110842391 [Folsomia candida]